MRSDENAGRVCEHGWVISPIAAGAVVAGLIVCIGKNLGFSSVAQKPLLRLTPPSEQQVRADIVTRRDRPDQSTWLVALRHKPNFILHAPAATTLPTRDDFITPSIRTPQGPLRAHLTESEEADTGGLWRRVTPRLPMASHIGRDLSRAPVQGVKSLHRHHLVGHLCRPFPPVFAEEEHLIRPDVAFG